MSDSDHNLGIDHESEHDEGKISQSDLKNYEIGTLIQKAGGFGKLQWLIILFGIIADQGINYFIFTIAYLELVPSVLCKYTKQDEFVKCYDYKDICKENYVFDWKVDYDDKYSFHNWITDQNLYCKSDFMIGLFGSIYFVGFGFLGVFLKFSDKYGRKKIVISSCIFQALLVFLFLFSDDYRAYYVIFFFAGISITKETILFIYRTELVPDKYQIYISAISHTCFTLICYTNVPLYFYYGGKNWKYAYCPAAVFITIASIISFFIPESPRYLYSK